MNGKDVVNAAKCGQSSLLGRVQTMESSRYFRMGAAVALGEAIRAGVVADTEKMRAVLKEYLESFGIRGMEDIEALGIGNVYRYDFESIFR